MNRSNTADRLEAPVHCKHLRTDGPGLDTTHFDGELGRTCMRTFCVRHFENLGAGEASVSMTIDVFLRIRICHVCSSACNINDPSAEQDSPAFQVLQPRSASPMLLCTTSNARTAQCSSTAAASPCSSRRRCCVLDARGGENRARRASGSQRMMGVEGRVPAMA
jgi:hypothetical protein